MRNEPYPGGPEGVGGQWVQEGRGWSGVSGVKGVVTGSGGRERLGEGEMGRWLYPQPKPLLLEGNS